MSPSRCSCKTNTYAEINLCLNGVRHAMQHAYKVRNKHAALPIGRTARIAFEIDAMRAGCSEAARFLLRKHSVDELELEECAVLDDALARANRLLKHTVRDIMLSRLRRRSKVKGP